MTSIEKLKKAEKLFSLRKKVSFLKPAHTFYAIGISLVLSFFDLNGYANLLSLTSLVVSVLGLGLLFCSISLSRKGFNFLSEVAEEMVDKIEDGRIYDEDFRGLIEEYHKVTDNI